MPGRRLLAHLFAATGVATLVFGPVAAAEAVSAVNAPPTGSTTVIANCVKNRVEPRRIIISCGDASLLLRVDSWSRWHTKRAVGTGAILANDCDPNCAGGTFHETKSRIVLYHPRATANGTVFTRARAEYVVNGKAGHDTYRLVRKPIA